MKCNFCDEKDKEIYIEIYKSLDETLNKVNKNIIPSDIISIISVYAMGDIKECYNKECNKNLLILESQKESNMYYIFKDNYYCNKCYNNEKKCDIRPENVLDRLLEIFGVVIYPNEPTIQNYI